MNEIPNAPDLPTMSEPACYRIRVRGSLDPSAGRRLQGMSIRAGTDGAGGIITTLTGVLPDQAALRGVLQTLYTWLLPVLSVELHTPEARE